MPWVGPLLRVQGLPSSCSLHYAVIWRFKMGRICLRSFRLLAESFSCSKSHSGFLQQGQQENISEFREGLRFSFKSSHWITSETHPRELFIRLTQKLSMWGCSNLALCIWKRALTRTWPCWHPDLGLPVFITVREKFLLFTGHPVYTILVEQSKLRHLCNNIINLSMISKIKSNINMQK